MMNVFQARSFFYQNFNSVLDHTRPATEVKPGGGAKLVRQDQIRHSTSAERPFGWGLRQGGIKMEIGQLLN